MANKPIISIDVDSEPFQRFQKLFEQYVKDVKSTNAEWKAMIANHNAALKPLTEFAHKASQAYDGLAIAIRGAHTRMGALLGTTRSLLGTVTSITRSLLKWGSIAAGAGFFGADLLANAVLGRSREARGIGLSVGQQSAFRVNQAPALGSPDTVLSNVALARQDYSKWWALSSLGVNPYAAQGENPFDLTLQLEGRARALWNQHPNVQWAEARGLTQFFSIEDLRRLGGMSDADFARMQSRTRADVGGLGFGAKQTQEWQSLAIQVHRAGLEIERVFVDNLAPLARPLKDLSQAIVDSIQTLLGGGGAKRGIEALAEGIREAANYLASPKFQADVRSFVDDMAYAAQRMAAVLRFLGILPPKPPGGPSDYASGKIGGPAFHRGKPSRALITQGGRVSSGRIGGLGATGVSADAARINAAFAAEAAGQGAEEARGRILYDEYARLRAEGRDEPSLDREIARYGANWRRMHPGAEPVSGSAIERLIRITKGQKRASVDVRIHNETSAQVAIQANNAVAP